ncbi:MAG TPA: alpha/beta hydrolase [Stellaceae bacterium]|jgi:pimeloyl-ACP methyl ester carboxylesterase|nr:alpha/beta hydrolase [Stellaceae bacterium]
MEAVHSTITLCGTTIPMKRAGTGPAMLVLHGAGGSPRFLPAMQKLAERFEVFIPQAPGFGGTELPDWLESIADVANFYREFLDKFDLRHVHLVGLSLGGWTAAALAIRDASRLASLTLMDAPGIVAPGIPPRDPARENDEQVTRDTYFDPKLAEDARARIAAGSEAVHHANRRLVEKLAGHHRYHDAKLQAELDRIRIPTHIIWGANDKLLPPVYGETWQKAIAGSRLTLIPRSGHLPIQEQPELFAAAVGDFCARL